MITAELQSELVDSFLNQFQPPFQGTVNEWASQNIDLQGGEFEPKGSFDVSVSSYPVPLGNAYPT